MRKNNLFLLMIFYTFFANSQELVQSYSFADGYLFSPKMLLERKSEIVVPYYITKDDEKKAGILYLNKDNTVKDAILFQGKDDYVINQIIESNNGNLLLAAEGYSQEGQESLYFIELNENTIVNEFIFNENGNELDPFAILEVGKNILVGGFIKSRELVSNAFYNMYSETQMIYVGEFTKDGQKKWSKAIDLEGYENGICTQMIKQDNGIVLLCNANKVGENMSPILVNIDFKGNVKKIIELEKSNTTVVGSRLLDDKNKIKLVGFHMSDVNYLFNYTFDQNLELSEVLEYVIPGRPMITYFNQNTIGGSISRDNSYNNLVIHFLDQSYSLYEFGSAKTNILVGGIDEYYYGYNMTNTLTHASTFDVYRKSTSKLLSQSLLKKADNQSIEIKSIDSYNIITDFIESSINKGISKVRVEDVKSKILQR